MATSNTCITLDDIRDEMQPDTALVSCCAAMVASIMEAIRVEIDIPEWEFQLGWDA